MIGNVFNSRHDQCMELYFNMYGFGLGDERAKYLAYKKGKLNNYKEGNDLSFTILNILENLGLSDDQIGLYAYCELIKKIVNMLDNDIDEKVIISNLMMNYSDLYRDVANAIGFGTNTFHDYIKDSFSKKNINNIDKKLERDIFGEDKINIYGIRAYYIADYIRNKFSLYDNRPKIKSLSNK